MELFNQKNLKKNIGTKINAIDEHGGCVELTITEVNKSAIDGDEWEAFTVIYKNDGENPITQGIYKLHHECIGEQELFLCPNSGTECETIISREKKVNKKDKKKKKKK